MVGQDVVFRAPGQGLDLLIGVAVAGSAEIIGGDRTAGGVGAVIDDQLGPIAQGHAIRVAIVAHIVMGRIVAVAPGDQGPWIQEPPPALPRPRAGFVIAPHHRPGRGAQERVGGREEVRPPGVRSVAPGAARATGLIGRAGVFAVEVIAHMDDQIGLPLRRRRRDPGEGVFLGIVAGLVGSVAAL